MRVARCRLCRPICWRLRGDDDALVVAWRARLQHANVWANDPVPLYPYPSSPDYRKLFGTPDDSAWERAHAHYLGQFTSFSDIQDGQPLPLAALEVTCGVKRTTDDKRQAIELRSGWLPVCSRR